MAERKLDMMDGILAFEKMGGKYARILSDYPETVQKVLEKFLEVWMIPDFYVPKKTKRPTSDYKEWIAELQSLESICGGKLSLIQDGYEHYMSAGYNFMVTCPRNILRLMVDMIAKKNRDSALREREISLEKSETGISLEEAAENIKRLKNSFSSGE